MEAYGGEYGDEDEGNMGRPACVYKDTRAPALDGGGMDVMCINLGSTTGTALV